MLEPGDLLVVNNSGTLPAALDARPEPGRPSSCTSRPSARGRHLAGRAAPADRRQPPRRFRRARVRRRPGLRLQIPGGALDPAAAVHLAAVGGAADVPGSVADYLARHGRPDPVRLRRPRLADGGLSDRLRHRAGQRRDAQRRPPVDRRGPGRTGRARDRRRADHPAHRRRLGRGARAAVRGVVRRSGRRPPAGRAHPCRPAAGSSRSAPLRCARWSPRWTMPGAYARPRVDRSGDRSRAPRSGPWTAC